MAFSIEVGNKFDMNVRDIQVRRKSRGETLEEMRANYPASKSGAGEEAIRKVELFLGAMEGEEDYLEISVVEDKQQSDLGPCMIDLRSNVPFRFIPGGTESITVMMVKHLKEGKTITTLRIPSGPPTWKLEIMRPPAQSSQEGAPESLSNSHEGGMPDVTVNDDDPGGWGLI
jgi:hypothetical protein